jgi:CheY-like chemotaxis protein
MKTILLVDDEYALVDNWTELLRDEGYLVVSASNGKDGADRLKKEKPDLVVTDLMMPIADGRELVRSMEALPDFRTVPVIMMSATTRAVALTDANGAIEVTAFLKKPVQWQQFLDVVVRLIGPGHAESTPAPTP